MNSMLAYLAPLSLPILCLFGDFAGQHKIVQTNSLLRAVIDNGTHLLVGSLSWLLTLKLHPSNTSVTQLLSETLGAGLVSSLIDLDHFMAAGSFNLKAATSLTQRPFFHNSLVFVVLLLMAFLFSLTEKYAYISRICVLGFSSIFSHHCRDAWRRGFWFSGVGVFGVSYNAYLLLMYSLPFINYTVLHLLEAWGTPRSFRKPLLQV